MIGYLWVDNITAKAQPLTNIYSLKRDQVKLSPISCSKAVGITLDHRIWH